MNQSKPCSFVRLRALALSAAGLSVAALTAHADLSFLGVAAGDATTTNAVLWTRAVDASAPAAADLTAQVVANDATFSANVLTFPVSTDATKDYTAKLVVNGLTPNTRYYYRFQAGAVASITGTFKTAPDATAAVPVHFAFSGDMDGLIRPYDLAAVFPSQNLDFYANVGDTIYETASTGSAAVTSTASATKAQLFSQFSTKYREQFLAVNAGGQNGLQPFYAAQGNYTLYDNHELGNKQYINGGAPAGDAISTDPANLPSGKGYAGTPDLNQYDFNTTGTFMNKSAGFQTLERVFLNYQPINENHAPGGLINAPSDPRSDGTPQLFLAQQWGKNAILINTDTRTYRDIRLKTAGSAADDTGSRAAAPNRTVLGATQLAWLEQTLLGAQNAGTPWKFVVISDPMDQLGPIGGALTGVSNGGNTGYAPVASDGGKSYMGGYRAERNAILKFIADNHIYNVVFLTTDDHQNRVNELSYSPTSQTEDQATYVPVPHCFQVVCGPLGATGPDFVTNHTFANNKLIADSLAAAQIAAGIEPVGLNPNYPGLHDVVRDGDPNADTLRQPVDFYSPDTFNFNVFDITPDGQTLTIKSIGINSYAQNSRPEYDPINNPARTVFSFQVDAARDFAGIDHFIVVYQENWSFDSLYGSFPGANGIANASSNSLTQIDRLSGNPISSLAGYDPVSRAIPTQNPPVPLNTTNTQDIRFLADAAALNGPLLPGLNTLLPYDITPYLTPADLTGDIVHRYWQEQFQIDGGAMDKFVTWSDNPGLVMSHFDATSMPEGILAQQYTMCDNFFHSAFGGSFLNHQFLVAAAAPVYPNAAIYNSNNIALLDGQGVLQLSNVTGRLVRDGNITPIGGVVYANTNQVFDKNYAVNTIFSANLAASGNPNATTLLPSQNDSNPADPVRPFIPTIGDRLDEAGISWKWYSGGWDDAILSSPSNPAHFGTTLTNVSSLFQWHHQAFAFYDHYAPWTNGVRNPGSAAHLQDEKNFFNDVASNTLPSVVFIKPLGPDNEHPGYASLQRGQLHVSNIVAAVQANPALWAHSAIIVTYDEHGGRWDHVAPPVRDIWGPGARVPGIIISPLAKSNYVDHTQYETLSILSSIEKRFGIAPLTAVDAAAPTLAPAFDQTRASSPEASTAPKITAYQNGGVVSLAWQPGFGSYVLQAQTNSLSSGLGNNWVTVPGVTNNTFIIPVDPAQPAVFYRLVRP